MPYCIGSGALPFLTFSITAPYRPVGKSFPPITLRPRIDTPEVGPPPRLSLRLLANGYFQILIVQELHLVVLELSYLAKDALLYRRRFPF